MPIRYPTKKVRAVQSVATAAGFGLEILAIVSALFLYHSMRADAALGADEIHDHLVAAKIEPFTSESKGEIHMFKQSFIVLLLGHALTIIFSLAAVIALVIEHRETLIYTAIIGTIIIPIYGFGTATVMAKMAPAELGFEDIFNTSSHRYGLLPEMALRSFVDRTHRTLKCCGKNHYEDGFFMADSSDWSLAEKEGKLRHWNIKLWGSDTPSCSYTKLRPFSCCKTPGFAAACLSNKGEECEKDFPDCYKSKDSHSNKLVRAVRHVAFRHCFFAMFAFGILLFVLLILLMLAGYSVPISEQDFGDVKKMIEKEGMEDIITGRSEYEAEE